MDMTSFSKMFQRRRQTVLLAAFVGLLGILCQTATLVQVEAYHRQPCTWSIARQFQFPDCYAPSLAENILLSKASFVMAHDAATGYLPHTLTSAYTVANSYAKNQIGNVYQQLNDGARALDVRPKLLANGTVVLHHGGLVIPTTLSTLVQDAMRWCHENPDEPVLILHSHLAYPTTSGESDSTPSADVAVAALSQVYKSLGVTYVHCSALYGLTVGETRQLAALDGGGFLIAMDQQDAYASSCAKANWVEDLLVTCYSSTTNDGNSGTSLPCTNLHSSKHQQLKDYVMASANNEPTDSNQQLGPPASTYTHPFNEIQALWQVDSASAALGITHVSTLLDDNIKSQINANVVDWVYQEAFDSISLMAVDHVHLNGNALFSVLRNQCGQFELSLINEDNDDDAVKGASENKSLCGTMIAKPNLQSKPMSTLSFFATLAVFGAFAVWVLILLTHYRQYYNNKKQLQALDREIAVAAQQFGCGADRMGTKKEHLLPDID
jgi:hypothetical protein